MRASELHSLLAADTHGAHPCELALGVLPRDGPPQHLWNSGARLLFRKRLQQMDMPAARSESCPAVRSVDAVHSLTQNASAL
jgi:hypothetical protein